MSHPHAHEIPTREVIVKHFERVQLPEPSLQAIDFTFEQFLAMLHRGIENLPAVVAETQNILSGIRRLVVMLNGGKELPSQGGTMSVYQPGPEELKMEADVVQAFGLGDGGYLRSLFTLLRENPQLLMLILSLLKGK